VSGATCSAGLREEEQKGEDGGKKSRTHITRRKRKKANQRKGQRRGAKDPSVSIRSKGEASAHQNTKGNLRIACTQEESRRITSRQEGVDGKRKVMFPKFFAKGKRNGWNYQKRERDFRHGYSYWKRADDERILTKQLKGEEEVTGEKYKR